MSLKKQQLLDIYAMIEGLEAAHIHLCELWFSLTPHVAILNCIAIVQCVY